MAVVEEFRSIAQDLYIVLVQKMHGARGVRSLKVLLNAIPIIYRYLDPETMSGPIVIIKNVHDDNLPNLPGAPSPVDVLSSEFIKEDAAGPILIQILTNGRLRLWSQYPVNPVMLSQDAIVYEYKDRAERIFVKGSERIVPKVGGVVHSSMFAVPCFSTLKEAFDHYRVHMAKVSSCKILSAVWFDDNRIFLKAGPEEEMRDSLLQFLAATLRGVEVRPEQNTGVTNPVDIKVKWLLANRIALIEIKWLGKSVDASGEIKNEYYDSRARAGAKQLAEYLDNNQQYAPDHITRGYLVVYDARRRGISKGTKVITQDDGLHYKHLDVEYKPKFHETRDDFEVPVRFFLEPRI